MPYAMRSGRYRWQGRRALGGSRWEFSMEFTERELFTVLHGLVLGTLFLLAFGAVAASLYSFKEHLLTDTGVHERVPRIKIGTTVMAVVAWLTVFTGTWIAYPWYRARPP